MITDYRSCSLFNSPCQHPGKCIENSKENMHTDVSVLRVKMPLSQQFGRPTGQKAGTLDLMLRDLALQPG